MKLTIEVGPLEQYENRLKLLCKLEENGVTIKEKAKENGAKFTRIYTIYMDVKDWADRDEILQVMNNIYNNADFNQVVSAIDDTIASFINGEKMIRLKNVIKQKKMFYLMHSKYLLNNISFKKVSIK